MNLPHPFEKAKDVKADAQGTINLIDYMGKALARIPMTTAFELSTESEGYGFGSSDGSGDGFGDVYGDGYGDGSGGSRSK